MRTFRNTHRLLTLAILALLLAGCFSAPAEPPQTAGRREARASAAAPPTVITWSFWGNEWETQINRRVARAFEAEHPSIKVEMIHQPWDQYFGWLESQWQRGTPPDVMFLNNIRGYAVRGVLEPLDTYMQRDRFGVSDFYPGLMQLFNYQNLYYGLPRDNDTKVIYYNKHLLAQAGLDPPHPDWTWNDLQAMARVLTQRDAAGKPTVYGFAFESEMWWRIWVWQNGGDILDDPLFPSRVRIDEPEAIQAIQFLADLINVDRVTPPPEVLASSEQITQLFREGKIAMAFGSHGKVPGLSEEPDLEWDVVGLPRSRLRANLAGGAGYTISATSQNKEAAWSLVRFLESPKGQALFAESGLVVPARRSIREDHVFLRRQPYATQVFVEETELGRPNLNIPQAGDINRILSQALQPVWRGERTAAEAIREVAPAVRYLIGGP